MERAIQNSNNIVRRMQFLYLLVAEMVLKLQSRHDDVRVPVES